VDGLTATPRGAPLDEVREQYLQLLLERFEKGELQAYEYTRRVRQVELAASIRQMVEIVEAPSAPEPALDAVDMLQLARTSSPLTAQRKGVRLVWPIVIGVFFVILLAVGMWLVGHAKALHGTSNGGVGSGVVTPFVPAVTAGP